MSRVNNHSSTTRTMTDKTLILKHQLERLVTIKTPKCVGRLKPSPTAVVRDAYDGESLVPNEYS